MSLERRVRNYLESLAAAAQGDGQSPVFSPTTEEQLMTWVMAAIDVQESNGMQPAQLHQLHERLSGLSTLLSISMVEQNLGSYVGVVKSSSERAQLLKGLVWLEAGLKPDWLRFSQVAALEKARKVALTPGAAPPWDAEITHYCRELYLVHQNRVTELGSIFLQLVGIDAVTWLLAVECELSIGPEDTERISPDKCKVIAQSESSEFYFSDAYENVPWYFERLNQLSIVTKTTDFESDPHFTDYYYRFTPQSQALLKQLGEGTHPFLSLVASLVRDLRNQTFEARLDILPPAERNAESTARLARDVAHEVRNKLQPIQSELSRLYRAAEHKGVLLQKHQPIIEGALTQLHEYLHKLLNMSKLVPTHSEPFDPVGALRDAVAQVEGERRCKIQVQIPEKLPRLVGQRDRFVLALVNLLRNAAQAVVQFSENRPDRSVAPVRLAAAYSLDDGELVLQVEDAGPGVPPHQHSQIFDSGFSLTPGGSGHGLSLAKQVIEQEFKGHILCDDSPELKGARFTSVIPLPERNGL